MNSLSILTPRALGLAACLLLAGFVAATVPGFFHTFDISDEGIHLYSLIAAETTTFLSPFYAFFNLWGEAFGQTLVAYRVLGLLSVLLGGAFAGYAVHRFAGASPSTRLFFVAAAMAASFAQFVFSVTFSYNACAMLGASIWAGALLLMLDEKTTSRAKTMFAGLAALGLFTGLLGRPPCGVALIVFTPVLMVGAHYIGLRVRPRDAFVFCALLAACSLAFLLAYPDLIERLIRVYPFYLAATHASVLHAHFDDLKEALLDNIPLFVFVGAYIRSQHKPFHHERRILLALGVIAALMALWPFLKEIYTGGGAYQISLRTGYLLFPLCIALCIYYASRFKTDARPLMLTLVCVTAAVGSGLGTNSALLAQSGSMLALFILPLMVFALYRHAALSAALLAIIALSAGGILISAQFTQPFRAALPAEQTNYAATSAPLKGVKLDPELARTIDRLSETLEAAKYDRVHDRIMAFPDMPGFIAAVDAQAFGTPWMITAYDHSDGVNCAYVSLEPVGDIKNVYFLLGRAPEAQLQACLDEKLKPGPGISARTIGPFTNRRNKTTDTLTLVGPYVLR